MNFKNWISRAGYFVLALASLLLIISPYFDIIGKNISAHTWVGIFCGVLCGFIVYYESIASHLKADINIQKEKLIELSDRYAELVNLRNQIQHENLFEAIRIATGTNKSIRDLRIYASTTAVIFQIVRDLKLNIDDCKVMLQTFNPNSANPNSNQLNQKCIEMTDAWIELKDSGRINKLQVIRYDSYPTEYIIIIDNKYLIVGKYVPNDSSKHGSDYHEPVLYSNQETASKTLIDKNIKWYDNIFKYYSDLTRN